MTPMVGPVNCHAASPFRLSGAKAVAAISVASFRVLSGALGVPASAAPRAMEPWRDDERRSQACGACHGPRRRSIHRNQIVTATPPIPTATSLSVPNTDIAASAKIQNTKPTAPNTAPNTTGRHIHQKSIPRGVHQGCAVRSCRESQSDTRRMAAAIAARMQTSNSSSETANAGEPVEPAAVEPFWASTLSATESRRGLMRSQDARAQLLESRFFLLLVEVLVGRDKGPTPVMQMRPQSPGINRAVHRAVHPPLVFTARLEGLVRVEGLVWVENPVDLLRVRIVCLGYTHRLVPIRPVPNGRCDQDLDDTLKTSVGDFQLEITEKLAGRRRITTASLRRTDRYNTQPQLLLDRTAHDTTQVVSRGFVFFQSDDAVGVERDVHHDSRFLGGLRRGRAPDGASPRHTSRCAVCPDLGLQFLDDLDDPVVCPPINGMMDTGAGSAESVSAEAPRQLDVEGVKGDVADAP